MSTHKLSKSLRVWRVCGKTADVEAICGVPYNRVLYGVLIIVIQSRFHHLLGTMRASTTVLRQSWSRTNLFYHDNQHNQCEQYVRLEQREI